METKTPNDTPGGCTDFCTLPPVELHARAREIRASLLPRALDLERSGATVLWHFPDEPELRAALEEFVAFERRCCSDTRFTIEAAGPHVRVRIEGPAAAAFAALAHAGDEA